MNTMKKGLVKRAEFIHDLSQRYLHMTSEVLKDVKAALSQNQEVCRDIGLDDIEPYAVEMEKTIFKLSEEFRKLAFELEGRSSEYVEAMKQCDAPEFPRECPPHI